MICYPTTFLAAAATAAALGFVEPSHAFQSASLRKAGVTPRTLLSASRAQDSAGPMTPCAIPDGAIPGSVTAQGLRAAFLTNADGDRVTLGECMGKGTSIVVFLRHLG